MRTDVHNCTLYFHSMYQFYRKFNTEEDTTHFKTQMGNAKCKQNFAPRLNPIFAHCIFCGFLTLKVTFIYDTYNLDFDSR